MIEGLTKGSSEIHKAVLSRLTSALEDRGIEQKLAGEPGRYLHNKHQSKPRKLKCFFGTISHQFAQLRDHHQDRPIVTLVKALLIQPYDRYLNETMEGPKGLTGHVSLRLSSQNHQ